MTPELLAAARKRDEQEQRARPSHELWPDMAPGVLTFFALDTQWKRNFIGKLTGLDYAAILPTSQMLGLTIDPQAFHDIRIMESEVLRTVRKGSKNARY